MSEEKNDDDDEGNSPTIQADAHEQRPSNRPRLSPPPLLAANTATSNVSSTIPQSLQHSPEVSSPANRRARGDGTGAGLDMDLDANITNETADANRDAEDADLQSLIDLADTATTTSSFAPTMSTTNNTNISSTNMHLNTTTHSTTTTQQRTSAVDNSSIQANTSLNPDPAQRLADGQENTHPNTTTARSHSPVARQFQNRNTSPAPTDESNQSQSPRAQSPQPRVRLACCADLKYPTMAVGDRRL